jgi:hypothetical protein
MNRFELELLYKNETGNTIPSISNTFTYEDSKDNILEEIKETETIIAQLSYTRLNEVKDKINELEDKLQFLKEVVKDLNTDIDVSLDNESKDYIEWLETKIMNL